MVELIIVFALAGLVILWKFGIKPAIEDHINNKKVIRDFYGNNKN